MGNFGFSSAISVGGRTGAAFDPFSTVDGDPTGSAAVSGQSFQTDSIEIRARQGDRIVHKKFSSSRDDSLTSGA